MSAGRRRHRRKYFDTPFKWDDVRGWVPTFEPKPWKLPR